MSRSLAKPAAVLAAAVAGVFMWGAHIEWPSFSAAKNVYIEKAALVQPSPENTVKPKLPATKLVPDFADLAEEMSPTVVNIYTTSGAGRARGRGGLPPPGFDEEFLERFGFQPMPFSLPEMKREALGSGFVINAEKGLIVTNAHVVTMGDRVADEIMVKFKGEDKDKGHPAKVLGADKATDVALLKLTQPVPGLKAAALGDSAKARVGEWVLAIGNPYGHTHTVLPGIVSALGRTLEGARSEFMQTSAGINPGNSGGPLINMNGEVVGINSAIDPRAPNIGFAIPINVAKGILNQLEENGRVKRAWLGLAIGDLSDQEAGMMRLKDKSGVLVRQVMEDAPAAKAGIEPFDIIRKVDGTDVKNTQELYQSLDKLSAGKTAELEVLRAGTKKMVKVQLGEAPATTS